jgi:hypothetical protein
MKPAEQLLLKALGFSLAIHLAVFGGWKWGRTHLSWKPLALPAWLTISPHNAPSTLSLVARNLAALQPPQPTPVLAIYVDVSPDSAVAQPPPNAKYYSTANSLAANTDIKVQSDKPNLSGTQENVMKTVPSAPRTPAPRPAEPAPLQPSPRDNNSAQTAKSETGDGNPIPKPASTAGDMAGAKPAAKPRNANGTADSDNGTGFATEPHQRPRTLVEAMAQKGAPGQKTRQDGGVNHIAMASVDAAKTVYGDYDRDFIDAVQSRWYALLKNREDDVAGKVVLEFNLHADGRITDMKRQYSDVNELMSLICQQAALDPAPYKPWPAQMLMVIKDPRPIRFTFYYSY